MADQFPKFLEKQFLKWQNESGERKTLDEFAIYLGISRPLLSMWMNGTRRPGSENIVLLVEIFGLEVYDALSLPRPDPFLSYAKQAISRLNERQKKKLTEQIDQYLRENEKRTLRP